MPLPAIWMAITAVASAIGKGIAVVADKAVSLMQSIQQLITSMFNWFLHTAPRGLQIVFFLFFILTFGAGISSMVINMNYVCTSDNVLLEHDSFIGGLKYWIKSGISDSNITDEELLDNTHLATMYPTNSEFDIVRVRCLDVNPRLTFFGLDIFSYRTWVLLLIIGILIKVIKL